MEDKKMEEKLLNVSSSPHVQCAAGNTNNLCNLCTIRVYLAEMYETACYN